MMPESVNPKVIESRPLYQQEVTPGRMPWWMRYQQLGATTVAAAAFLAPLHALPSVSDVLAPLPGLSLQQKPVCHTPSAASQAVIEQLLLDPFNVKAQALKKAQTLPVDQRGNFVRQSVAQTLQLRVNDIAPTNVQLRHAERFEDQKAILMSYISQFGIAEVGPAKPQDLVQDWKPIAQEDFQDEQLYTMRTLANTLEELPEEYVKATGITRVVFANNFTVTDENAHLAYVHKNTKGIADQTMVVNISKQLTREIFNHEFYHKIDEKSCGSGQKAGNDPAFTSLAKAPEGTPAITLETYAKKVEEVNRPIKWSAPDCAEQVARANAVLEPLAEAVVLATPYAAHNTLEQKAELFSGTNRISPRLPKLRRQLMLLLARLDITPNLAKYMTLFQAERLTYLDLQTDSDEPDARRCG